MKNVIKIVITLLSLLVVFFLLFNKTEIYSDGIIEAKIVDENTNFEPDCGEKVKWEGHIIYSSGPFYELNIIESTIGLESLLEKKESVKKLKIDSQNLKELPEELFLFKNLEALDISDNPFLDLEKLMVDLSKFPKLELLAMSHCGIVKLPDNIYLLENLIGLSIDQNIEMTEVNENLGKLKKLKYLSFRRNKKLKDLPESIGELKCLEQIIMSGAGFVRIREELSSCKNLINITANASKIQTIPENIGNLKSLKTLNLAYNKIEHLPESIGELSELKDLSLAWNELSYFPKSFSNLDKLYSLSLQLNRFTTVPTEIFELNNLRYLNLHNSSYQKIPLEIADLDKLKRVYVDHELISDDNIESLRKRNLDLVVEKRDEYEKFPEEPKRKN